MEILKVEKLTNEKWLNLFAAAFRHNDHVGRWVFASRKAGDPYAQAGRSDAVIIVPVLRDHGLPPRLVLEKEFRVPAGGYVLRLPAAVLEPGERIGDAVHPGVLGVPGPAAVPSPRLAPPLYP